MDHLLENYKTECCRLDLPEGLRELMSDISREVLRAQPPDICRFIANYLSALMVTRDDLAVASQLCHYVCECECHPELLNELMDLGLDSDNAEIAQDIIMKHLENKHVNEANILAALLAKTTIDASMYPDIVDAVRAAYARHQAHMTPTYEKPPEDKLDEVAAAASHTLELYRRARPTDDLCGEMATKIQASYRAYGVRRESGAMSVQPKDSTSALSEQEPEVVAVRSYIPSISDDIRDEIELTASLQQKRVNTASSISLAGSLCAMPKHRPYTAQDIECLVLLEETEKENTTIDYTMRTPNVSEVSIGSNRMSKVSDKRISFRRMSQEELFYDQALYEEHDEVATAQVVEEEHFPDILWTENSDATYFEDVTEMNEFDDEEFKIANVNDDDIEYINNMNMHVDSDSGEDQDTQKIP